MNLDSVYSSQRLKGGACRACWQRTRASSEEENVGQENTSKIIHPVWSWASASENRRSGTNRQSQSQATHWCSLHKLSSLNPFLFSFLWAVQNYVKDALRQPKSNYCRMHRVTSQHRWRRWKGKEIKYDARFEGQTRLFPFKYLFSLAHPASSPQVPSEPHFESEVLIKINKK